MNFVVWELYLNKTFKKRKNCDLYAEFGWELLKNFKQGGDMVGFVFLEDHSGCSEENGFEEARLETGIPLQDC